MGDLWAYIWVDPAVPHSRWGLFAVALACSVALTVAMVIKTGQKCLTGAVPVALCAAAFVLNGLLRWPLLLTLALLAPLCLVWAWPRRRNSAV